MLRSVLSGQRGVCVVRDLCHRVVKTTIGNIIIYFFDCSAI
jgi:hypothetical protein